LARAAADPVIRSTPTFDTMDGTDRRTCVPIFAYLTLAVFEQLTHMWYDIRMDARMDGQLIINNIDNVYLKSTRGGVAVDFKWGSAEMTKKASLQHLFIYLFIYLFIWHNRRRDKPLMGEVTWIKQHALTYLKDHCKIYTILIKR